MITKAVAISGTVGKQVYTSATPVRLKSFWLSPLSAAAYIKIRMGNASGDIIAEYSCPANASNSQVEFDDQGILFTRGMHVKVLGTGAVAYLYVE